MLESLKVIGVFADPMKPGRTETVERVIQFLRDKGLSVLIHEGMCGTPCLASVSAGSWDRMMASDLLIAIGGDGSILRLAKEVIGKPRIPAVVGVKMGRLGFLAATPHESVEGFLKSVLMGEFLRQERMMLQVERRSAAGSLSQAAVLNEVVLSTHAEVPRLMHAEMHVDGREVITYSGDGLIFSTPTGSTAHALSAGGPIVDAEMRAIVVVPICPHTLSNRPLVIDDSRSIHVRGAVPNQAMRAVLDGQNAWFLEEGDELYVSVYPSRFPLLYPRDWNPFSVLRQKLHWRGSMVPLAGVQET